MVEPDDLSDIAEGIPTEGGPFFNRERLTCSPEKTFICKTPHR
jgi:hypothetical protein